MIDTEDIAPECTVFDTGSNLPPAANLPPVSLTLVANLPPVSITQGELVAKFAASR
jgi:hypothetical protein